MKKLRKITGNKKGIDTILAALLMVVIVVVASVMVYAWSTGLLGTLLVQPNVGKESLLQEGPVGFNNCSTTCKNVTINIRNTGSVSASLVTYYVKDSSGNQWSRTSWTTGLNTGPSIAPGQLGTAVVLIDTTCGTGCTYAGTASAFQNFANGNTYTVLVVTTRNNQFSMTVTR